jgi:hypothetical protein
MRAITYENTRTTLPGWAGNLHESQGRGVAYETDAHFVHFYCRNNGWYTLSPGLTVTEKKRGSLQDWVIATFGATNIQSIHNDVGTSVRGVWRPGLTLQSDLDQGLGNSTAQRHNDLVALRLLLSSLEQVFEFVEPVGAGLGSYGHKTRELLIAACTEVENQWKRYFTETQATPIGRDFRTNDYVKLCSALSLKDYRLTARAYATLAPREPFQHWETNAPTQSLPWYDAYNKTKHDRALYFDTASVENCIDAVTANAVMFCARYSPHSFFNETGGTQLLFQQLFEIDLPAFDPATYYVPKLVLPSNHREDLLCYDSSRAGNVEAWSVQVLAI